MNQNILETPAYRNQGRRGEKECIRLLMVEDLLEPVIHFYSYLFIKLQPGFFDDTVRFLVAETDII